MKRFEIGFYDVTKDDRHISFPEILDMAPYCTAECLKVRMYIYIYIHTYARTYVRYIRIFTMPLEDTKHLNV